MGHTRSVPPDLLAKCGEPWNTRGTVALYSATQIASGLGISEQTVHTYSRQGRIPLCEYTIWGNRWTAGHLALIAQNGIKPAGYYHAVPEVEKKRLRNRRKPKPIVGRGQKGGAA